VVAWLRVRLSRGCGARCWAGTMARMASKGAVMTARQADIVLGSGMVAGLAALIYAWVSILTLVMPG
jgi:hypothetical protein